MTATLKTLAFLDEHPERGRVDEADCGQVNKDRIRPHCAGFVDPSLKALSRVQVELA